MWLCFHRFIFYFILVHLKVKLIIQQQPNAQLMNNFKLH